MVNNHWCRTRKHKIWKIIVNTDLLMNNKNIIKYDTKRPVTTLSPLNSNNNDLPLNVLTYRLQLTFTSVQCNLETKLGSQSPTVAMGTRHSSMWSSLLCSHYWSNCFVPLGSNGTFVEWASLPVHPCGRAVPVHTQDSGLGAVGSPLCPSAAGGRGGWASGSWSGVPGTRPGAQPAQRAGRASAWLSPAAGWWRLHQWGRRAEQAAGT